MAAIRIRDEAGRGFTCGIEGWIQSPEEKQEWQQLLTRVVQFAFESRSVTLITLAPMKWSIGHSLPKPHELKGSEGEFLVNHLEKCSPEVLAEIAASEEFHRGLLWLFSAVDVTDKAHLHCIAKQLDVLSPAPIVSNCEVLLVLDDGRCIHWLHPTRQVKTLERQVLSACRKAKWRVSDP